jgi:hypothetical protein
VLSEDPPFYTFRIYGDLDDRISNKDLQVAHADFNPSLDDPNSNHQSDIARLVRDLYPYNDEGATTNPSGTQESDDDGGEFPWLPVGIALGVVAIGGVSYVWYRSYRRREEDERSAQEADRILNPRVEPSIPTSYEQQNQELPRRPAGRQPRTVIVEDDDPTVEVIDRDDDWEDRQRDQRLDRREDEVRRREERVSRREQSVNQERSEPQPSRRQQRRQRRADKGSGFSGIFGRRSNRSGGSSAGGNGNGRQQKGHGFSGSFGGGRRSGGGSGRRVGGNGGRAGGGRRGRH